MPSNKLKITLISLLIVGIILWNFWYYTRSLDPVVVIDSSSKTTRTTEITTVSQTSSKKPTPESSAPSIVDTATPDPAVPTRKRNIAKTTVGISPVGGDDAESWTSSETTNYDALEKIFDDTSWSGDKNHYSHYWGNENVSSSAGNLKILYPKGSNAPSNTPRGWAGFVYDLPKSYDKISLSYAIRFDDGFDFVKGGKLPGLCGGNCSRGESMPTASGFSMRFVWKKNGYLDIMTFFPNTVKAGNYSWEKMFKFIPGKEYLLTQELTLNDIGKENGVINILVDGKVVYTKNNVTIRVSPDVQINSFLFSTFFWGKDDSYSSTKDMSITFWKFKISDTF